MNERELMPGMTLENIARACQGRYIGDEKLLSRLISGAVTDSRQVTEGCLFIPIKGERVDGHDFIPQVFAQGALAVLSEKELENPAGPYILVESSTQAMKDIAAFYRGQIRAKVVGITGSVGKTSTKEMIASVLEEKYSVLKTAGNFNNEIGLPLTLFRVKDYHDVAVVEMGISDFGEMHRLGAMARPDISVITNIGCCHLENLGDRDGVLRAKTEVFEHLNDNAGIILNGDDDKLATKAHVSITKSNVDGTVLGEENQTDIRKTSDKSMDKVANCEKQVIDSVYYGLGESSEYGITKQIYATDVENLGFDGMTARVHTPKGVFDVHIHIPGQHNVYNALCATAVGLELGLDLDMIKAGIEKAKTIAGRTNFIKANDMTIIDDCYNANPASMKTSLEILSHAKGRQIAVLGDMGELGSDEAALHYEVGEAVGRYRIHTLFCAGKLAVNYAKAAKKVNPECDVHYFENRDDMLAALKAYVRKGDTILVKASHFMEFTEVVTQISC